MSDSGKVCTETLVAQGLHYVDPSTGAVVPPIQPSTTFARDEDYQLISASHSYGRDENPVYATAESMLAHLEDAEDALLFSSGMAAAMAVVQTLEPGDHIVAPTVPVLKLESRTSIIFSRWRTSTVGATI